jgi:peptide/nickel transport system substrate-binding protein
MVTRRGFIRRAVGGTAALLAASAADPVPRWTRSTASADDAATLNVGEWVGGAPATLDPGVETSDYAQGLLRNVYEPLVDCKGSSINLEGVLATKWSVNPDGTQYTFELRRDVKFSDGTPFDASAAKLSIERVLAVKKGPYWVAQSIKQVEARDQYTVVVMLSSPFPMLPAMRLIPMISPAALSSKAINGDYAQEWLSDHSAGTGAYVIDHWDRRKAWVLLKNRGWYGWAAREPRGRTFDTVVIQEISEPSTQLLMLQRGALDIAMGLSQNSLDQMKGTPGIATPQGQLLQQLYVRLNIVEGPTKDVRVRQALNYLWDYKALNAALSGGIVASDGPLPRELVGPSAPNLPYRYDLDKAKQLLQAAGYPNGSGLKLNYWTVEGDEVKRLIGEVLSLQLTKVNVAMETVVSSWPAQYQALSGWAKSRDAAKATSMFPLFTGPRFPDPYSVAWWMYDTDAASPDGRNWGVYSKPGVDAAIRQAAAASAHPAKEREIYAKTVSMIADDAPDIFVGKFTLVMPMRSNVKGYIIRPCNSHQVLFYDLTRT